MGPGTKDEHVTPAPLRDLMTRKANPVVRGGVVCGSWSRKGDELDVRWLDDAPAPEAALRREADRIAEVFGIEPQVSVR